MIAIWLIRTLKRQTECINLALCVTRPTRSNKDDRVCRVSRLFWVRSNSKNKMMWNICGISVTKSINGRKPDHNNHTLLCFNDKLTLSYIILLSICDKLILSLYIEFLGSNFFRTKFNEIIYSSLSRKKFRYTYNYFLKDISQLIRRLVIIDQKSIFITHEFNNHHIVNIILDLTCAN